MLSNLARIAGLTGVIFCGQILLFADGQSSARASAGVSASDAAAGWRSLSDGKTLSGWTTVGDVRWSVADGAFTANPSKQSATPMQGFLRSTDVFGDFELKAEFWADPDANSGLFIRCGTPARPGSLGTCYEINVSDDHPVTPTGGIVGVHSTLPYRVKSVGKWSLFEVRAEGNHLIVKVNGETTVDAHDDRFTNGAIGLQAGGPNGPGLIRYRNIRVRPLPGAHVTPNLGITLL